MTMIMIMIIIMIMIMIMTMTMALSPQPSALNPQPSALSPQPSALSRRDTFGLPLTFSLLLWGKERVEASSGTDRIPQQGRLAGGYPEGAKRLAMCIHAKLEFIQISVGFP